MVFCCPNFQQRFCFCLGEEAGADAAEGSGDAAEAAADGSGDANGSGMDIFIHGRTCFIISLVGLKLRPHVGR